MDLHQQLELLQWDADFQVGQEAAGLASKAMEQIQKALAEVRGGRRYTLELTGFPDVDATLQDAADVQALLKTPAAKTAAKFLEDALRAGFSVGLLMDRLRRSAEALGVPEGEETTFMAEVSEQYILDEVAEIKGLFADGFQISDVGKLLKEVAECAQACVGLTGAEKKELALKVAERILDETDVPWLPDHLNLPLVGDIGADAIILKMLDPLLDTLIDAAKGRLNID